MPLQVHPMGWPDKSCLKNLREIDYIQPQNYVQWKKEAEKFEIAEYFVILSLEKFENPDLWQKCLFSGFCYVLNIVIII